MAAWQSPYDALPVDGSTVYIRVVVNDAVPVSAVWDATNQTFTTVATSILVPVLMVSRWKLM